ncbi:MAG TPA: hypothetical protein VFO52_08170 [Longimicrobiales bacterium]|nr:hypothetical protein [Longimicrobiales bacterium]
MTRAFAALTALTAMLPGVVSAQQTASRVLSSEIAISRQRAEIQLELENGRKLTLATTTGTPVRAPVAAPMQRTVTASGDELLVLEVDRGSVVDRSWRDLLNAAMEASPELLATLLRDWQAPRAEGAQAFDAAIEAALQGAAQAAPVAPAAPVPPGVIDDSVVKLESKIQELEEQLDDAREHAIEARNIRRGPDWLAPFRRVWQGITGIFSVLITYIVLFGIGFVAILFGGRKYLEGVADTVRVGVGRSFLVGLAGSFLLIPVFVLGCIALAISIVGIPALLVWVPLFPVGAVLAVLLGFLGVAHSAGESWAERNYYGSDWFRRGNSYYFMMTGLMLLASLFFAANVVHMAGPWLDFLNGILNFFGIVLTWAAATIGFGAVLISRGGSRPAGAVPEQSSLFTEDANV